MWLQSMYEDSGTRAEEARGGKGGGKRRRPPPPTPPLPARPPASTV